jgi:DNA-directed RNA polymerase subunit RPC12/RpoP
MIFLLLESVNMAKKKNFAGRKGKKNQELLFKCSFCGADFAQNDLLVLEEKEQKTTLHGACFECGAKTMVFVSSGQAGVMSVGMATDLDRQEVKSKFCQQVVGADDIIEIHEIVSVHNGNSGDLLKKISRN